MPGILGKRPPDMSRKRGPATAQFAPLRLGLRPQHRGVMKIALPLPRAPVALACALACATAVLLPLPARAEGVDAGLAEQLQRLASHSATQALGNHQDGPPVRVEVELGQLDPRLKLAPCEQIQPYLPGGARPVGRTRIGLRCVQGAVRWNVYLPVTVRLFGQALVTESALPAGTLLEARHLHFAEVDLAASADPAITTGALAIGRTLARPLAAGETLRRTDLRARQFFNAGDVVRVVAVGAGYAVSAEGQAVTPGIEGQPARVKVESGRVLSGTPTGNRRVELAL